MVDTLIHMAHHTTLAQELMPLKSFQLFRMMIHMVANTFHKDTVHMEATVLMQQLVQQSVQPLEVSFCLLFLIIIFWNILAKPSSQD